MRLGKYNQAKTVKFSLVAPDGIDLIVAATFAAGDIKISKDEGAEANTTNLPTDEGTGYSLVLTATEMSAARISLYIIDQTATKVWLDIPIEIETYGNASAEHAFDLDTANVTLAAATHTGAVIPTVTTLTNLPSIPANWLTAAGIAAGALDGKGNWNIGKTGYTLTQTFPANFADMAITITTGKITIGTNDDKVGYSISGTKQTLDALNDIATSAIVSSGAITTLAGAVVNVDLVDNVTSNTDMRGTDGANTVTPDNTSIAAILNDTGTSGVIVATNNDKTGYALSATGLDLILSTATGFIAIAKAVWDRIISKANHNIGQSGGKILRQSGDLIQIDGTVSDATPSVTSFDTSLTQISGYFNDAILVFANGSANSGIGKPISVHINTGGNVTFVAANAWPVVPVNGDDFVIVALHSHPITELQAGLATEAKQDIIDANLDLVLEDTNTTIPAQITALNDPTAAAIAAAVAAYDMGNGRTIEEALAFLRNKWTIIGGVLTVYDTDDSTILWTSTMTTTAGDPVSASDPV